MANVTFIDILLTFQIILIVCIAQSARSIIVKDPPMSDNRYKYAYEIEDPTTGNTKSQHEVRKGDVVNGAYSVLDPDGTHRTVYYTADPKYGFKAIVTQEPVEAVLLDRQPSVHLSQELFADIEFSYPYDSVPENYAIDSDPYAQVSLPVLQSPAIYFTPANEIKNNKRTENRHYFIPNCNYNYVV